MRDRLHYGEVAMAGWRLVTSGMAGYVNAASGRRRLVRGDSRAPEPRGYLPVPERAA